MTDSGMSSGPGFFVNTNVTFTSGEQREDTDSCRCFHQCHTTGILYTTQIVFMKRGMQLARKNWEENTEMDKLLFRFSYGSTERMETRGYFHVLAYREHTKRLHYVQECCLDCQPKNHSLLDTQQQN